MLGIIIDVYNAPKTLPVHQIGDIDPLLYKCYADLKGHAQV